MCSSSSIDVNTMAAKPDNFSYFSLPGEVRNQIMNHVLSYVESEVYIPAGSLDDMSWWSNNLRPDHKSQLLP